MMSRFIYNKKIEQLDEVERAHVHVDYEFREQDEHKPNFGSGANGTTVTSNTNGEV